MVGQKYLFMTVTHYFTGEIAEVTPGQFTINKAAWIPNTGRLSECIQKGTVQECEPVGDGVVIPRPCIAIPWHHALPLTVK